jgi:hypothetical protein
MLLGSYQGNISLREFIAVNAAGLLQCRPDGGTHLSTEGNKMGIHNSGGALIGSVSTNCSGSYSRIYFSIYLIAATTPKPKCSYLSFPQVHCRLSFQCCLILWAASAEQHALCHVCPSVSPPINRLRDTAVL